MARKGAMNKEPRRRQVPQREGQPPMSPPVRATQPREKAMERLSPGVYRGSEGGLVNQGGRLLNRPQQQQRPPMRNLPQPMQPDAAQAGADAAQIAEMNNLPQGYVQGGTFLRGKPANSGQSAVSMVNEFLQGKQGPQPDFNAPMPMSDVLPNAQIHYTQGMPADKMYRYPAIPQMPQPSANMGGQYRLSPGMYGNQQQAMNQYDQQMQQMYQPMQQVRKG